MSQKKMALNTDSSSPFQSSPMEGKSSPRLFWQNKNNENMYGSSSSSPKRRQSIERLQKASRVKNSNILALEQKHEYDPTKVPQVERPLAKVQGNAFSGTGISGYRDNKAFAHTRSESQSSISLHSPTKSPPPLAKSPPLTRSPPPNGPRPASRDQASPTKSSLATSRFKSSQDHDANSSDSSYEDRELPSGRVLHRQHKSVTFDAAPPQINEYEMATPDISSIGTSSREGSYDSAEDDDDDDHYFVGAEDHDDSFDATLEDTIKTPVVLPDDWRQDMTNPMDAVFETNLMMEGLPPFAPGAMFQQDRSDSRNSNGDHRPLPPLPGMNDERRNSTSSMGLSATAERMVGSQRTLPSPPPASSFSKSDIQNIGNGKMTLEERLKLMMLSDDGKSAAEQQRERRLRRASLRDHTDDHVDDHAEDQTEDHADDHSEDHADDHTDVDADDHADDHADEHADDYVDNHTPEAELPHEGSVAGEDDDTLADMSVLGDYQLPPKISRESIMRRVDGNQALERESDYNLSSAPSSPERTLPVDPDVPIPSTEEAVADEDDSNVQPKQEDDDDMSITDYYQNSESEVEDVDEDEDDDDVDDDDDTREVDDETDDSASNYSDPAQAPTPQEEKEDEDHVTTPRASTPNQHDSSIDTITEQKSPEVTVTQKHNPFTDDLQAFMLPKPVEGEVPKVADIPAPLERPSTPERLTLTLSKPEYDGSGWGEPDEEDSEECRTPDSVIHRPFYDPEEEEEARISPAIPETVATIKSASGSKLKTRPSATPSDIAAMREQRRHVSREVPDMPPVPERHRHRTSQSFDSDQLLSPSSLDDDYMQRHPSFKSRSLTLDLDLGLSLDQDFERVIEAQKVNFQQFPLQAASDVPSQALSGQASRAKLSGQEALGPSITNLAPRTQRGYLMRQNTKVVTASDKDTEDLRPPTRSAGNSPVKQIRPQSWTVEPWNGQTKKKSNLKKTVTAGPVPPMPGYESNVAPMSTLPEEDATTDVAIEDNGERGRLFVKVMGVKDLDLPIPKSKWI